jgi:hypothetical protein
MRKKYFSLPIILIMVIMTLGLNYTSAQAYAYGSDFISTIHYQNIGDSTANVSLVIYGQDGSVEATHPVTQLAPGGATSLYAGSISGLDSGFTGSAVLSSDQPLATTIAQVNSGSVKNQPLSNGFSAGSDSVLIPTVLKNQFYFNSVFSVQNVDSTAADLTFTFKTIDGAEIVETINDIAPYASYVVDMGATSMIHSVAFNGSVFIEAVQAGTSTPGSIVASSMELQYNGNNAYAFNGVPSSETSTRIYMPTAVCKFGPTRDSTSAYAIQNPNDTSVDVTVKYSNGHVDGPYRIAPYAKRSFDGCSANNPVGFLGSATVTATNNVQAVGKVYGGGLYPAHLGFTSGSDEIALPFVRWTEANWLNGTGQRSYIAIQNIGSSTIPAGGISVNYYDKDGNLVGTHQINSSVAVGGKVNSHPYYLGSVGAEFGTYSDGSSGGGAIVVGPNGSQLAVVVRVQKYTGGGNSVGEDYEGIPIN